MSEDMIDGLRLTIPGDALRRLLEQRMANHRRRADWWKGEQARTPEEKTEDEPLPDHMCANEAERHEWRAAVLGFIRDGIEPAEVYRLGEEDLAFGELLPEKPGSLEPEEYDERKRFIAALDKPPAENPRLRRLLAAKAPWER